MANHRATPIIKHLAKGPVRVRARHATPSSPYLNWKTSRRKFAMGATAVAMSALLAMPNAAFAATYLEVGGTGYDAANGAASGEGWSWDGGDNMVLDGYNGGYIYSVGDLNIELVGDNTVSGEAPAESEGDLGYYGDGIGVYISGHYEQNGENGEETWVTDEEGDLSISGDGSLKVSGGEDGLGVYAQGSIAIEDASVEVNVEDESAYGIRSDYGDVSIKDADVSVSVEAQGENGMAVGILAYEDDLVIEDSTVSVEASSQYGALGVRAGESGWDGNLIIENSDVSVSTKVPETASGAWGMGAYNGEVTIENSKVTVKNEGGIDGDGIASYKDQGSTAGGAVVTIKNSDVSVSGYAESAIASILFGKLAEDGSANVNAAEKGTIVIAGSTISLPYGAKVLDTLTMDETDYAYGQVIGTGNETITDWNSPAIAKDLVIKSAETAIEETLAGKDLPTTGDTTNAVPLLAAGLTAAAVAAFARRKAAE